MAEIHPFRAWRYSETLMKNIGDLTSPLFDVASEKQKAALYGNPYNSIHLSIPDGECPSENAAMILQQWRQAGCIQHDSDPAIYVYYQYFRLPVSNGPSASFSKTMPIRSASSPRPIDALPPHSKLATPNGEPKVWVGNWRA